jgi:hypothetical protein
MLQMSVLNEALEGAGGSHGVASALLQNSVGEV